MQLYFVMIYYIISFTKDYSYTNLTFLTPLKNFTTFFMILAKSLPIIPSSQFILISALGYSINKLPKFSACEVALMIISQDVQSYSSALIHCSSNFLLFLFTCHLCDRDTKCFFQFSSPIIIRLSHSWQICFTFLSL